MKLVYRFGAYVDTLDDRQAFALGGRLCILSALIVVGIIAGVIALI